MKQIMQHIIATTHNGHRVHLDVPFVWKTTKGPACKSFEPHKNTRCLMEQFKEWHVLSDNPDMNTQDHCADCQDIPF